MEQHHLSALLTKSFHSHLRLVRPFLGLYPEEHFSPAEHPQNGSIQVKTQKIHIAFLCLCVFLWVHWLKPYYPITTCTFFNLWSTMFQPSCIMSNINKTDIIGLGLSPTMVLEVKVFAYQYFRDSTQSTKKIKEEKKKSAHSNIVIFNATLWLLISNSNIDF